MDDFTRKVLRRLVFRPETLSRNKYFSAFDEPQMRRLRRSAKHLRSVLDALVTTPLEQVSLAPLDDERWEICIESPATHARRTLRVSGDELGLLCEHPASTALRRHRRALA